MKLSPSGPRQRRVDAVPHERVHELQTVGDRPQEGVPQKRLAGGARILDQRP